MSEHGGFYKGLHVLALFGFAVAQPLFDLLSQNADFLVAHKLRPFDLLVLVCMVSLLFPGLLVLVEVLGGFLHRRVGEYVHALVVGALVGAIALQISNKLFAGPGMVLLLGSVAVSVVVGWASCRVPLFQSLLTFLSPAIVLFPVLFLLRPPVSGLIFEKPGPDGIRPGVSSDIPIVFLVFDELSTSTLMSEHLQINAFRYPNFAALARDSHWFRKTSTVAERSTRALPAILTGRYTKDIAPPTAANYPENLFTWLAGNYELNSFESVTNLCPEELCREPIGRESFSERVRMTLSDLAFVYLHVILPADLAQTLPSVTATMRDFGAAKPSTKAASPGEADYGWVFSQFLSWIQPADGPVLYFMHTFVPHTPWTYLPSGKQYGPPGAAHGLSKETWGSDQWETVQAFQRHLLQTNYADRLLGTLLGRLREADLYDRSLIIVTADHGLSFWPNESRRSVGEKNQADILAVPLFVKLPYQQEEVVSDRNVEIIDILPTIADVLNAELPWAVDGRSALGPPQSERSQKQMFRKVGQDVEHLVFKPGLEELANTVRRKISLFGSGEDPRSIYRIGRFRSLAGRKIEQLAHVGTSDLELELKAEWSFQEVDLDGTFIPAHIAGQIVARQRSPDRLHLAVAVNGRIEAVTQTYRGPESPWSFTSIVPETVFKAGSNRVEVFVVSESENGPSLAAIRKNDALRYSLTQAASGTPEELIISSTGRTIRIVPGAMGGWVDVVRQRTGYTWLSGWASDGAHRKPADEVVGFVDGEANHDGHTVVSRADVAKKFETPAMAQAGFSVFLPSAFGRDPPSVVRVFAISSTGVASELRYLQEYEDGSNKRRIGCR